MSVNEARYFEIIELQKRINNKLYDLFNFNKTKDRQYLATLLIHEVEGIIGDLNNNGYNFGRFDYSGDSNYENSEQSFSDGKKIGEGIILHFHGFSVQASWEKPDNYLTFNE